MMPDAPSYNVEFLNLTIKTIKNEGSLVENIPIALIIGDEGMQWLLSTMPFRDRMINAPLKLAGFITDIMNTTKFPYDFADTYAGYSVSRTFDSIVPLSDLSDYAWRNRDLLTNDIKTIANGNMIIDNSCMYIKTYQISQRYNYTCSFGEFTETLVPDGGLKIISYRLDTSKNNLKPIIAGSHQTDWDERFSSFYSVDVVFIMLDSMLQIYLFSSCFNKYYVMYKS